MCTLHAQYLDWAVQLHNVMYTALPILVFAVFDRDLSLASLDRYPYIYPLTRGATLFNLRIFCWWMLLALSQGLLCFFLPLVMFENISSPEPEGQSFGIWSSGMCIYVCVVLTTNLKVREK
jgi:phospholipid-translocating ATPase